MKQSPVNVRSNITNNFTTLNTLANQNQNILSNFFSELINMQIDYARFQMAQNIINSMNKVNSLPPSTQPQIHYISAAPQQQMLPQQQASSAVTQYTLIPVKKSKQQLQDLYSSSFNEEHKEYALVKQF